MPTFEIEQYELHAQAYRIEAASEAEAIKRLLDGEADAVDNGLDYIEIADDFGLSAEEHGELADDLRALGITVREHVIPSIRSIHQLE